MVTVITLHNVVVMVTVIALCVVLWSWSQSLHCVGVAVTIFMPHVGRSHCRCAACGVMATVAVVAPCGCCCYNLDYPFSFYLIISDSFSLTDTAEWLLLVFQIII